MSALIDAIHAVQCHVRHPIPQGLSTVMDATSNMVELRALCAYEYKLEAVLGYKAIISTHQPGAIEHELKMARRAVVHHVFGEFRPFLIDIQRALAMHDLAAASKAAYDLDELMFRT